MKVEVAVNPLLPFTFIYSFTETLTSYLGEVTETTIRENFDIVYMVRTLYLSSSPTVLMTYLL